MPLTWIISLTYPPSPQTAAPPIEVIDLTGDSSDELDDDDVPLVLLAHATSAAAAAAAPVATGVRHIVRLIEYLKRGRSEEKRLLIIGSGIGFKEHHDVIRKTFRARIVLKNVVANYEGPQEMEWASSVDMGLQYDFTFIHLHER